MSIELKVGSKGELFLPKSLRVQLDLKPGDTLILDVNNNKLILRKPPSLDDLLRKSPLISLTVEEINSIVKEIKAEQVGLSIEDLENVNQ